MFRLLELSLATEQILKDMSFYADLGFLERPANEIVAHHYGILGDGRFHVGLHQADFESPTLTYVLQDVARYASSLRALGADIERADLSDDQFNQISLRDPDGQRVNLIEARTFSPSLGDDSSPHPFGRFIGIELPHSPERERFWSRFHGVVDPAADDEPGSAIPPVTQCHSTRRRLTVVFEGDLDALIVHSASNGWQRFSVNSDDLGVFRTPHKFDLLVRPACG